MITAIAVVAAIAPPVSAAPASIIDLSACNVSPLGQAFAPWLDPASYELAPGGDFETSSWRVSGGAQLVPGSEPFAATGTLGTTALSLPAGASAQSPPTCVDAAYPTLRLSPPARGCSRSASCTAMSPSPRAWPRRRASGRPRR